MTELTLKLIIILIPGALGAIIVNRLTIHKDWTPFLYTLNAIIIGLFGYLSLQLAITFGTFCQNVFSRTHSHEYKNLQIWNTISDSKMIPYKEVWGASLFGIIIGFFASYFDYHGVINTLGRILKISNKYGDQNLFSHFLNSKKTEIVYVRDIKRNLTYHGIVDSYSENDTISEILLSSVSVYNYTDSELLYTIDKIYLSFAKAEVIIELAKLKTNVAEIDSTNPEASTRKSQEWVS